MAKIFLVLTLIILSSSLEANDKEFVIKNMRCDYASNPNNLDTKNPRFSWIISSKLRGQKQTAYQLLVSKSKDMDSIIWDSGKRNSSSTNQIYYRGESLESNSVYYWKVKIWDKYRVVHFSKVAHFGTSILKKSDWTAEWIGSSYYLETQLPNGFLKSRDEQYSLSDTIKHEGTSLLLRNEFMCSGQITNAKVFVTGLGFYELYINGNKIEDQVLTPAKTNYAKEVLYDTYDVTNNLREGKNVTGLHLGNGWFNPYKKWWQEYRMQWFGAKRAILQLHIDYKDGHTEVVVSDENWKFHDGPILYNCIYDGEYFDATKEIDNWSKPNYDDSEWEKVRVVQSPKADLRSQSMQAIKVVQTIIPTHIIKLKPNVIVYDMGQNFAGWVKIKVRGRKGTKLHLRYAEDINEDGTINPTSNEHAKAEATYILKGGGAEVYEPRFTFYGFKYVEISSDTQLPEIKNIEGCVVHSNNQLVGIFECGNEIINKIHSATLWSQKSNMVGYPLDCPQRDERLGWFGDAQVTADEAMFNFDMSLFYNNWITGIRTNQNKSTGDIPIISPRPYIRDEGVEWSSTYLILVWKYYIFYGDENILRENYFAMKQYVSFLDSISENNILKQGWIGDWGSLVSGWQEGEPESIPTAFYYWDSLILSKIARVLGESEDLIYFEKKAKIIKESYNKKYFDKVSKNYNDGSQMANAFPLYLGLVPVDYKQDVLNNLVHDIVNTNKGHLTTGVLGSKYMIDALVKEGRPDIAYQLAIQTGYPSWSDMVEKYTTMCEFWTLKQSHNHIMTGSIDAFFYNTLAGINISEENPGFEEVIIKPYIPKDLSYAKATVNTIRGKISSEWSKTIEGLTYHITIPANVTAILYITSDTKSKIYEGDSDVSESLGVHFINSDANYKIYSLESGEYNFLVR